MRRQVPQLNGERARAEARGLVRDRGPDATRFVNHLAVRSLSGAAAAAAERAEAMGLAVHDPGILTDSDGTPFWLWDRSEWDGEEVLA